MLDVDLVVGVGVGLDFGLGLGVDGVVAVVVVAAVVVVGGVEAKRFPNSIYQLLIDRLCGCFVKLTRAIPPQFLLSFSSVSSQLCIFGSQISNFGIDP